jgi:hypothetical protein
MTDSLKTLVSPASKNTDSNETRPHHPYSPSTLQNVEYCPHYWGKQSEKPHIRTVAGTRAHGVVETGEDDTRLTDDDAVAAAECLDFVEQRRKLMQEAADREKLAYYDSVDKARLERSMATSKDGVQALNTLTLPLDFQVQELQETYLPIDDLKFPDCESTTAGYADRVLISHDTKSIEGFDWKFGFWPVEEPAANLQVIAYSLGLFKMFPRAEVVLFWIKQPHLDVTKSATFYRAQIPELYLRVQTVVARARIARGLSDFSMARPAVPVCNFCAEIGRCEKVCAFACKVGRKFYPLDMPDDITPTMVRDPKQTSLGLRLAAVLKVWCDAFRRQVTERIVRMEAELPPGQKIQVMSKRQIVDMAAFQNVALKYLTKTEY